MTEINQLNMESPELKKRTYYPQLDILKAVMIFLVIFDHTYPWVLKNNMGVTLWERISIPVFLVIMGFNMGISLRRTGETSLKKLYSRKYFKKKFWRYIFPFFIIYLLSSITGLAISGFNLDALTQFKGRWEIAHLFIGILPFWGPGNWFLPVLFWSILLMPLLYKGFSGKVRWGIITLILCFLVEILIQLGLFFSFNEYNFTTWPEYNRFIFYYNFIATTPFFMLSALGLGMWFSSNHNIFADRNIFMWILFPISLSYIILYQFYNFNFAFIVGDYHLFIFPYSAFLFLVGMKLLPKESNNIIIRGITIIGKSTYHILLIQILYFAIVYYLWGDHYGASILGINTDYELPILFLYVLVNWIICVPIGVFFWYGETKIRKFRIKRKNRRNEKMEK
ncbi:MAG: acyltransferase family protein [Promethearchaeota archaeon]|jgi:peptidoglycan/LPS O-acetylase OafA/YrhL